MTKKLLVPLFAISMAAFGCGSDSSPETGKDAASDVVTTVDGSKTDTTVTPVDGGADTSPAVDAVTDAVTPVVDAPVATDVGGDTSISNDTAPVKTDGGADAGSDAGDAGSDASKG